MLKFFNVDGTTQKRLKKGVIAYCNGLGSVEIGGYYPGVIVNF